MSSPAIFTIPKDSNPNTKVFINQVGGLVALHISEARKRGDDKLVIEIVLEKAA